jgi:PadR family transcriptional regulator PadR
MPHMDRTDTESKTENKKAQMRKGILEFCILLIISGGQVYSSDILEKLKKANLIVVEGTLYPLLSRLKTQELVSYSWSESESGPPRKYYALTEKGLRVLVDLKGEWGDLTESISHLENQLSNKKK